MQKTARSLKINGNPDSININGQIACLQTSSKHFRFHCCPAVCSVHKMTGIYCRPEAFNMSVAKLGQYTEPVYCIDSFQRVICRYKWIQNCKTICFTYSETCLIRNL